MKPINLLIIFYFIVLCVYGFSEILLQISFTGWKFRKSDRDAWLIMLPFYLSVYLPPSEHLLLHYSLNKILIITGFALLIIGIVLRIAGMLQLRSNFSAGAEPVSTSSLVMKGVYRYIRHPLYLALLIMSVTGSIIFSCIISWIFVILTFISILKRINKEEAFLTAKYPEYTDYVKKTCKLIPYIF